MYKGIISLVLTLSLLIGIYYHQRNANIEYEVPFEVYRGEDTNVLIKNSIEEQGIYNEKQERSMDSSLLMLIVSTAGIFATIIFNPKLLKIEKKLGDIEKSNEDQHSSIFRELKNFKTVADLECDLRDILNHCVEIAPKGIKRFINYEGENNIKFCKEVINSKFNETIIHNIKTKIESYSSDAQEEAKELPDGFRKKFLKIQKKNTDKAMSGIEEILYDDKFNSKHSRFRILMMQILNTHLHEIIDIYDGEEYR